MLLFICSLLDFAITATAQHPKRKEHPRELKSAGRGGGQTNTESTGEHLSLPSLYKIIESHTNCETWKRMKFEGFKVLLDHSSAPPFWELV